VSDSTCQEELTTNMTNKKQIKSLGQNFLKDTNIAKQMANSLDIKNSDTVIEIGGGLGALTSIVAQKNKIFQFDIFEIDKRFINTLKNINYNKNIKVNIYNENFLQTNLVKLYQNKSNIKVIGAIPYYITSPIIHSLLFMPQKPQKITLLIQKEVVEKIVQKTPKANYWSTLTSIYKTKILEIVKADSFDPKPKVDSAILYMELTKDDFEIPIQNWSKFLHLAYKNPRKMLNKTFSKELLEKAHIKPSDRPQNISSDQWLLLYDIMRSS